MALRQAAVFVSAPSTERGQATVITSDAPGAQIVYGSNTLVVIRSVENPVVAKVYTQHQHPVTVARISPSGHYCASADKGGNLRIWATNNEDNTLKLDVKPLGGIITDLAWSPDNQRMVVVGEGAGKFASAFLIDTGATVGEVSGHAKKVLSCDFKPSRPFRIATGGEDLQLNFYEGPPFKFKHSVNAHEAFINCIRYSPDGNVFASVGSDKKIVLYDGKEGQKVSELPSDHKGSIYSVAWSPDGGQLLTTAADKTAKLWDARAGTLITTFNFADPKSIDYMQVGGVIAGRQLLSLGLNGDLNYLSVDHPDLPVRVVRGHSKPVQAIVVDHANERIISASNDGSFIRWTFQGQGERFQGKGHTSIPTSLALLDGGLLASAGMDDRVLLSSVDRAEFLPDAAAVKGGATGITAIPGQPHVLVAVTSAAVYVLREGKVVSQVAAANPVSVSAAPQGHVAVGTKGKDILIYNLEGDNLALVTTLRGDHSAAVNAVKYNAAGTLLATGDANRRITIWKAPEYTVLKDLIFHSGAIKSVAFSATDRYLVSGGLDCTVIVWDLEKDEKIVQQRAHHGGVTTVAFLNDTTVVTGGMDACIRTWTLP